jgi:ABC-type nitrate/sulfonate/bicarbonate transport system permease component
MTEKAVLRERYKATPTQCFEIAMMLSLIGAIVAEFVGAQKGLGVLIMGMAYTMDVAGQFSVLVICH